MKHEEITEAIIDYLRATRFEVGLLFNFGPKHQCKRYAFENERKPFRVLPRSSATENPQ